MDDSGEKSILMAAETFEPHVGRNFRFAGAPQALTLDRVIREAPSAGGRAQPFTLIFRGPKRDVMPEGFYECGPEGGERYGLYVAPIHTPAPDRQEYQAAFN